MTLISRDCGILKADWLWGGSVKADWLYVWTCFVLGGASIVIFHDNKSQAQSRDIFFGFIHVLFEVEFCQMKLCVKDFSQIREDNYNNLVY